MYSSLFCVDPQHSRPTPPPPLGNNVSVYMYISMYVQQWSDETESCMEPNRPPPGSEFNQTSHHNHHHHNEAERRHASNGRADLRLRAGAAGGGKRAHEREKRRDGYLKSAGNKSGEQPEGSGERPSGADVHGEVRVGLGWAGLGTMEGGGHHGFSVSEVTAGDVMMGHACRVCFVVVDRPRNRPSHEGLPAQTRDGARRGMGRRVGC